MLLAIKTLNGYKHAFRVTESGFYYFEFNYIFQTIFLDATKVYTTTFPKGESYKFCLIHDLPETTIEAIQNGKLFEGVFPFEEVDYKDVYLTVKYHNHFEWRQDKLVSLWGIDENDENRVAFSSGLLPEHFSEEEVDALASGYGVKRKCPSLPEGYREYWL
jgi:hypothetical protein